ncbi:MAG: DUF6272 family protein, partial [Candidatus Cloacimonadota bacterium]|nr:DUF6272 family protein [Candidatus Cloacimonadota bacterium]
MTELYDFYNMFTSHSKKTIIFFKGNFTSEMLHEMAHSLKEHLASLEKKNISRKIFAIFIELAQNIYHYSSEKIDIDDKTMGDGIIHIYKDDGNYIIQSGNTIRIAEKLRIIV